MREIDSSNTIGEPHDGFALPALDDRYLPAASSSALEVEEAASDSSPSDRRAGAWLFRDGEPARLIDLRELPQIVADDANMAWADLSNYSEQELRALSDSLGVGPALVAAALATWQRPRITSTVLLPASLIVARFGTSFEGLSLYHSPARFSVLAAIMVLAIIVVTGGALLFFRRRGWL